MSRARICLVQRVGSFSYTPRAGNCLVFRRVGCLSDTPLVVIFLVVLRVGSFSYTPRDGICLVGRRDGESYLTRPVLASVSSFDGWRVSITCLVLESVSSISGWGDSLKRPVL